MAVSTRVALFAALTWALLAAILPVAAADLQWSSYGTLPSDAPAFSLAVDAANPATVYAATLGSGLLRTDDGKAWRAVGATTLPKRLWRVVTNASKGTTGSPPIYVASAGDGVFKSLDGGKTWEAANGGLPPGPALNVRSLAFGRGQVVIGTSNGVFRTSDGGKAWQAMGLQGFDVSSVAYAQFAAPTVVVATIDGVKTPGARVLLSKDNGATWAALKQGLPDNLVVSQVAAGTLPCSPNCFRPLFVAGNAGVFKSDDGGTTWGQLSGLPAQVGFDSIALSRGDANIVYVGSDGGFSGNGGVWRSTDRGGTFTRLEAGMDNKSVVALALGPTAAGQPEPVTAVSWDPDKPAVIASAFNDTQAKPSDNPEPSDCPEPDCQPGNVGTNPGSAASENPSSFPSSAPCPSPSPSPQTPQTPSPGPSPAESPSAPAAPSPAASSSGPTTICGTPPAQPGNRGPSGFDFPFVVALGALVLLLALLGGRIFVVRRRPEE